MQHKNSFWNTRVKEWFFVKGHLWCLIQFFCNFLCKRKQSKMPTCHSVSFLALILLHLHMATRVCSKPMPFPAWCGTQAVHCFGSQNACFPSTTRDECLQMDDSVSVVRLCKCRGSWQKFLKLGRSSRILFYFYCHVTTCMLHIVCCIFLSCRNVTEIPLYLLRHAWFWIWHWSAHRSVNVTFSKISGQHWLTVWLNYKNS